MSVDSRPGAWMRLRPALLVGGSLLLLASHAAASMVMGNAASPRGGSAVTTLTFHPPVLALHGIRVERMRPSAPRRAADPLSVLPREAPAFAASGDLALGIDDNVFAGFVGGT